MMNFCYDCGNKIVNVELFCSECGAKLEGCSMPTNEPIASEGKSSPKEEGCKYGVILTDTERLSKKFGVDKSSVLGLIESYVEALDKLKLKYKIVDIASYKKINYWFEYQKVLLDVHKSEFKNSNFDLPYLFIIGGNDIIPVPVINNYVQNNNDPDVETDILYGYPYGIDTQTMLESTVLYKHEMLYLVGRLPLASDASFNDLKDYLSRSASSHHSGGIAVAEAYGQCDPNWQKISTQVASGMSENGLFPNYTNELSTKIYNGCLFISPELNHTTIAGVFNREANIYYLNLHGSDQPDANFYIGNTINNTESHIVFTQDLITSAQHDNIFVTEACYGAKYVGYDKKHSILHSALMSKTLLFLGASRIAYGAVDAYMDSSGRVEPAAADILCAVFINSLFLGCSAAEALLIARKVFFISESAAQESRSGNLSPVDALTLAEFNLYGDPMLTLRSETHYSNKAGALPKVSVVIAPVESDLGFEIEDITEKEVSLLQRVRNAVDANISDIVNSIGDKLYAEYGIAPRKPKKILKVSYKNSYEEYNIIYEDHNQKNPERTVVTSDKNGNISSIYTSK